MHNTIPQMKEMLLKYNQIYLGPQSLDDYVVISTTPIKAVADLKGKKFYAPGASAKWLENTGAVAVDGGLPVYYNGIKTGVADGAILPATGIFPFKLHEVAPYVTRVGLGGGFTGVLTMNKDKYDSLPPELQKMFHDLGKEYGEAVVKGVVGFHTKSMEELLPKAGATVTTLPIEEQKKWAALLPDIAGEWAEQMEKKGLPGKAVIKAYMDGVRKRGIVPLRNWDQ